MMCLYTSKAIGQLRRNSDLTVEEACALSCPVDPWLSIYIENNHINTKQGVTERELVITHMVIKVKEFHLKQSIMSEADWGTWDLQTKAKFLKHVIKNLKREKATMPQRQYENLMSQAQQDLTATQREIQ